MVGAMGDGAILTLCGNGAEWKKGSEWYSWRSLAGCIVLTMVRPELFTHLQWEEVDLITSLQGTLLSQE